LLLIGGLPPVHRVIYTCSYFLPSILLVRMFGRRGCSLLLRLLFLECFKRRTEGKMHGSPLLTSKHSLLGLRGGVAFLLKSLRVLLWLIRGGRQSRKREERSIGVRHKKRSQLKCGRCMECCNQGEDLCIVVGRLSREGFEEELSGIRGAF